MRNIGFILVLVSVGLGLFGQAKREEISGIAKQVESVDYYYEQARLWRDFAQNNSKSANAWYNLYKAERAFLQSSDYDSWIENNELVFGKLEKIISEAEQYISPKNYELLIMKAANTNSGKKISYLESAFKIDPQRKESHEGLLVHYVIEGKEEKAREIALQMKEENFFSYANLMWNTNALNSVETGAIFIGFGDMDVIPKWLLQYSSDLRNDVSVLSLWKLAHEKSYFDLFSSKYGIPEIDLENLSSDKKKTDVLLEHILEHATVPIYMSCGSDISSIRKSGRSKDLYVNGVNLKYSRKSFDNTNELIHHFEEVYALEYLQFDYQQHQDDEAVRKHLNLSYLPGLQKIIRIMDDSGRFDKSAYYRSIAETIIDLSGRDQDIKAWFSNL